MERYDCPYLAGEVELSSDRADHIAERHPELLPRHKNEIVQTLADPDIVRRSGRMASAKLFSKWFDDLRGGKYVVVVVVTDRQAHRHWVVTAYLSNRDAAGEIEWRRV